MIAFTETHSEEVHEIISQPPPALVRWGMTLFLGLLCILGIGSWLVRYPDIVPASFTLTATDGPRMVLARSEGKLSRILIKNGQHVVAGQPLIYLESTGNPVQAIELTRSLNQLWESLDRKNWSALTHYSIKPFDHLGELQNDFSVFYEQLSIMRSYLNGGFFLRKRALLVQDQVDLRAMEDILVSQLELQQKDYNLAKTEFDIHEKLYQNKVISSLEYQREKVKLVTREMPLKQLASSLVQNRTSQTAKQKELLELDNNFAAQKGTFLQALQSLKSSVESWEQKFIVRAPVSGTISFVSPWQEQQAVSVADEILSVEPDKGHFHGLVKVSQANLGKVREGQRVMIKLDGYPYREFGMLEGQLSQLSVMPGSDSTYWGYIVLPNGLQTRYGKKLAYRNGLKGLAEIVTADRRLAQRLADILKDGGR